MTFRSIRLAIALAFVTLLSASCGIINWNQEPPYELAASWGEKGSGQGQFNDPTGIAVTADEVFVADARNSRIQVFDKQGRFKRAFGQDNLDRPMNLSVALGGVYIPDYFKDVIHVYTLGGSHKRTIEVEGGLNSPGGVAVYPDGTLLIADTYGQRIVHIDANGQVLNSWNGKGIWAGEFNYPTGVALTADGGFYVADGYNDRVQQFGRDGNVIRKWGGPFALNIFGPFKGWFATVTSVAVGPDGSVFVADFYNNRIQKFTADGDYLTSFGVESDGPGQTEIAVAVDRDGTVWSVNFDANRVEQWRP
ncbi:NHL repeat-containing protein [Marinobacter gelidimuriae]|uniref:NHL repeat-containing protein n=1 Tax=Marinobacter gelidimuriae TaxID=2739064 RepID=UPI000368CB0B|nr:NHL repeat-containing protein [Marinobacter gelidimuriae]